MIHPIVAQIVDKLHVTTTNRDAIRAIYHGLNSEGQRHYHRSIRYRWYRQAIARHQHNRMTYAFVLSFTSERGNHAKAQQTKLSDTVSKGC